MPDTWVLIVPVVIAVTNIQQCLSQQSLKAVFSMAGIKGDVTLTADSNGGVAFSWNVGQSGGGSFNWQLHQYYVNYDTESKCVDSNIGPRYGSAGGTIQAGSSQATSAGLDLNSIEGRTIKLQKVGSPVMVACATVVSTMTYETVMGRFNWGIYGDVFFRRATDSPSTVVYTNLYLGDSQSTPKQYTWKIYQGWGIDCKKVQSLFNPTSPSGSCSTSNHSNCPIGDLSSKLGDVDVGNIRGSALRRFTDQNLPVTGTNKLSGNTLVLLENNKIKYCTALMAIVPKQAMVTFSLSGVKGSIHFRQNSAFEQTDIEVNIDGLQSLANGYHVHNFPVPQRITKDQALCSGSYVGGHYNPYNINKAAGPADAVGTNDQYEIGDISGKFGGVTGNSATLNLVDWNMPLFGPRSIIHRSIVIHRTDGSRWVCANIEDTDPVTTAVARFTYPVIGHVIFWQNQADYQSDTSVFAELNIADGTTGSSTHNWQINTNMAGTDMLALENTRCVSTGTVYSSMTTTDNDYQAQCSSNDQIRCKIGDLSKKHGQVTVRAGDNSSYEQFFTDSNLPLSGTNNVIGKSVVLYKNSKPVACANIYEVRERVAMVNTWSTEVIGDIKFYQSSGLINGKTKLTNKLMKLNNIGGPYHVHKFPIPANAPAKCSGASVSGHFNPFDIDVANDPAPTVGTHDQYEMGDLSGKFGKLSGDVANATYFDTNLDLFGMHSIVGRSIVIHRASDSSRWSCGNIVEDTSRTEGVLFQAKAVYDTDLTGYVILSQYLYPDGSMSDTSVQVNVWYSDGSRTTNMHGWHVHENGVQGDDQALTGKCSSAGGHYNPFKVNFQTGYSECNGLNPLRCEVGDQAMKLGSYSVGGGTVFSTDVNLPVVGPFSVIGRSIVFHAKDKGAARIACANLMPVGAEPFTISIATPNKVERFVIASKIASSLNLESWEVVVFDKTSNIPSCTDLLVYFIGSKANARETLDTSELDFDSSFVQCSGCGVISTYRVILLSVFILGRYLLFWH